MRGFCWHAKRNGSRKAKLRAGALSCGNILFEVVRAPAHNPAGNLPPLLPSFSSSSSSPVAFSRRKLKTLFVEWGAVGGNRGHGKGRRRGRSSDFFLLFPYFHTPRPSSPPLPLFRGSMDRALLFGIRHFVELLHYLRIVEFVRKD